MVQWWVVERNINIHDNVLTIKIYFLTQKQKRIETKFHLNHKQQSFSLEVEKFHKCLKIKVEQGII